MSRSAETQSSKAPFSPFRRAFSDYVQQIKIEWRSFLLIFVTTGVGSICVFYAPPLVIASLLQRFGNHQNIHGPDLIPYLMVFGGVWLAGEALWRVGIHFQIKLEIKAIERLYNQAMDQMLQKDLAFFHNNFAGSLTKKTIGYAKNFEGFFDTLEFSVLSQILPLLFISFILWRFSPLLVVALIGMVTLAFFCIVPFIRRRTKLVDSREAAYNVASGHIADIYANVDAVRAFANEEYEQTLHAHYVSDAMTKAKQSWDYQNRRIDMLTSPFYVMTNVLGMTLALLIGGRNSVNVTQIFVTFSYFSIFSRFLWEFSKIYRQIESNLSEAAQFTKLLEDEPMVKDIPGAKYEQFTAGEIELKNVGFHYQDNSRDKLFENLNLSIKSGEKIGLVGHSGGGKTTITKLLLRFIDIGSGEILIDGKNIALITQNSLRSAIAYVPQDPIMFHRSIADNIRYGKLDASQAEIEQAAKNAHAWEFIQSLPNGFDTLVGERGVKLSGGQRQRVAIARAMVKQAPILVLDEATSALDSESEAYIQDALWKLMEGRTAIVIAHRLSTIQRVDRIIVLEKGKIVEEGTHKQLLGHAGIYADLWRRQSGGFLDE